MILWASSMGPWMPCRIITSPIFAHRSPSTLLPSGAVLGAVGQSPGLNLARVDQLVHRYAEDPRHKTFLPRRPVSPSVSHITYPPLRSCQPGRFAALLASQHLSHSSIKAYLSAVRHFHVSSCGVNPGLGEMVVLQGSCRESNALRCATRDAPPVLRLPITAGVLRLMKAAWEQQGPSFRYGLLQYMDKARPVVGRESDESIRRFLNRRIDLSFYVYLQLQLGAL